MTIQKKSDYQSSRAECPVFQSLRVDAETKAGFIEVCEKNGTNFSGALKQFCSDCIEKGGLPFEVDGAEDKQKRTPGGAERTGFWTSEESKAQFSEVCQGMGFSVSTVLRMFMARCVEEGAINNIRAEIRTCQIIMVDAETKAGFIEVCEKNGTNFSGALKQFCSDCIEKGGLPFEVDSVGDEQETSLKRTIFWTSEESKAQFSEVCQNANVSASTVLRVFMMRCVEEGKIKY